jgi:O-antigen/teichoic acid export membrane protein
LINNSKHIKRFIKNLLWLLSFQSIGYFFSLLSVPIIISKFGYSKSGYIFTAQAIVLGLSSLSNYSLNFYIPTRSKTISQNKKIFFFLWKLTISIRAFFSIILGIISIIICRIYFSDFFVFWVLSLSILFSKIISPNLFYNATEENNKIVLIGLFSKLLFIVSLFFIKNFLFVNFFFGLTELVVIIFILNQDSKPFTIKIISINKIFLFIKKTYSLFLVNLFSIIKSSSILPLISYLFGSSYATTYTLADKIINIIRGLSGASFTSFYPILNKENIYNSVLKTKNLIIIFSFSIILTLIVWVFSPRMIYLLNSFSINQQAVRVLQILSFTIPVSFIIIPFFSILLDSKKWIIILKLNIVQIICLFVLYSLYHQTVIQISSSFVLSEYILLLGYLIYFSFNRK